VNKPKSTLKLAHSSLVIDYHDNSIQARTH